MKPRNPQNDRLSVVLTPKMRTQLNQVAGTEFITITEVVRKALNLYVFLTHLPTGSRVMLVTPSGVERELVLL